MLEKTSNLHKLLNGILFPLRALFLPEDDFLFLSSLRNERMRNVAEFCSSFPVLDIGCGEGNVFINDFIGKDNGVGVDCFRYSGIEVFVGDMEKLPFFDDSFSTITLIAVGGHIPKSKRVAEFAEFSRVLKPNGKLIMTEGEPITQYLNHKWAEFFFALQGKKDMDSKRGMDDEEEYCMPKEEIFSYLNSPPLKLVHIKKFQWGLNTIYIAKKDA